MSDYNHHPYTINYVEFKDNGQYWDHQEMDDALQQLKAAEDDGRQAPLIVVYVHGWQNNASETSGDVVKFRGLMSRLADDYPVGLQGAAPPVLGIYIAWRGLTFTVEPFKHIVSYWPRRQVAKKIGQAEIHDAVCEVENADAVRQNRSHTFLILAGHSFGARVLENAIEMKDPSGRCKTMQQYFEQMHAAELATTQGHALSPENAIHPFALPNLPADLIIYVNAATSSAKTLRRVAQIRQDCPVASTGWICSADPLYIAFTRMSHP
jgi:hypothetical protein